MCRVNIPYGMKIRGVQRAIWKSNTNTQISLVALIISIGVTPEASVIYRFASRRVDFKISFAPYLSVPTLVYSFLKNLL